VVFWQEREGSYTGIIVKPNNFAASTPAVASQVNANFDVIYNAFNGNIDSNNLATNSVVTSKIADNNVTTAKINDSAVTTAKINNGAVTADKLDNGATVQRVYTNYSALATGTTTIPLDDTIPQNTEGTEFMSLAITPKSTTNILTIDAVILLSVNTTGSDLIAALFQDSTANALSAVSSYMATATGRVVLFIQHAMVAGTTSATTFKIRGGSALAGTTTFNGFNGNRTFGAITKSSITITETKAS